jgi:hypothetical protein
VVLNILPLQDTPTLYFPLFYNQWREHSRCMNSSPMCKIWGSNNYVAKDTFIWEIMLCWFINSYDTLKDQAHIQGQAVKEEHLSGTVLVYHIGMHCLSLKTRGLLSFGMSVTIYQLAQRNIPQDYSSYPHCVGRFTTRPVSVSVPCVTCCIWIVIYSLFCWRWYPSSSRIHWNL